MTRLAGDEVDRAARRVASVKGALRAAKNLDTIDVEQRDAKRVRAIDVLAVDVDDDRSVLRFVVGGSADAADADLDRALVLVDLDDWSDLADVIHV